MSSLPRRLEVRLDEQRFKVLEEESQRRGKSVSELVREAIDARYPAREARILKKLKAVEELGKVEAPVSSWEQMEEEIRRGMLG
ncbi:MAG: hypothetical protein COW32_03410 [Candidatus Aquicultor secundus]|uniref:Ribbon-helix-helix protein CopG domain-containing protein n=1 Tax=Candidatus Aquicultor secundus TaxID=1973895 RepID=A0A2M7T895_9ACTN|nr:ribbon-helix-helix protein, CopG family [Candidatus Aquicultor secundus]OIO83227.1 MAG: hypothetical protein AUK32_10425 [Candidatus Aquicultor secundus]PIU27842.1 MAG: hypothetical protein COT10_01395 [Candidatus Aquicultor secundus]PIW22662.1 MAG: hypothetical protein COW32_03410 [Candidatus Aquicultor secundus]PIX51958.1 MAG: hypothetical protein COZ51_06820 [Candidatus Aquicultor secundus]PIZ39319.1 MAG: hypothetical protein COY37_05060 [Candidatus Aquicultor secundus]